MPLAAQLRNIFNDGSDVVVAAAVRGGTRADIAQFVEPLSYEPAVSLSVQSVPQRGGVVAVFGPSANLAAKAILLGAFATFAGGLGWWWLWPRMDYQRNVRWIVNQPVPFSHQHHVAGLGIDCRMCHTSVEISANAGLPPTYTCMTCHSQIWTNAALLAPVRRSLADGQPIAWRRVTNLPDYVYFNHSIHIAKGVGCDECHGPVDTMPLMYKAKSLSMKFCLDCHNDPGPRLRPASEIYNTEWRRTPDTPPPLALMAQYHIPSRPLAECSICHR